MQRFRAANSAKANQRDGATLVETALVLPVFFTVMLAMIEFGHAYLIVGTLNSAAKRAARLGASEDTTTQMVEDRVDEIISAGMVTPTPGLRVYVKDASEFDDPNVDPEDIDYANLPDIEVDSLEQRDLFIVRIEVPYSEVALMPPLWAGSVKITAQSVMRHE